MPTVTVYTRQNCHLCAKAIHVIEQVADEVDADVTLAVVDVDEESAPDAYSDRIPVVEIDGTKRFEYRVDAEVLRQLLQQEIE